MDGTQPVWADAELHTYPPLQTDVKADVCVIGAGIAGVSAAYCLSREGLSVALLDDGPVAGGMTSRTSAHLSNAVDDRYVEIERRHGPEGARIVAESHSAAIDLIERVVAREGIDCGFERLNGYLFQAPNADPDLLSRELAAAQRAGVPGVQKVSRIDGAPFQSGPALQFSRQAVFHPTKYLTGVAAAAERAGVRIFCSTHAREIESERGPCVHTANGFRVRAARVVVATNSPINDRFAIHTKQAPYSTYVIAARVPPDTVPRALYWDTADPYHYVRLRTLPDGGEVLIVGGEDHKAGHADDGDQRFGRLEEWARERFPVGAITHRWSGQVMEPADGVAFIGRNPGDDDGIFIATGDSGLGLTHGTIAGILLTDLIFGRTSRWAELYDPARKMTSAPLEYAKQNLDVAGKYVADRLKGGEIADAAALQPGDGAVLRKGLKQIAAYRDENGSLHECSAVCPHLGCIVQFNSVEKTWDCPCHGSRFDYKGNVVVGPANRNLAPHEA